MTKRPFRILLLSLLLLVPAVGSMAQDAAQKTPGLPSADEEKPKGFFENLEKLRIDKEKKDHDEMVARGEEALKISADVARTFETRGSLSESDLAKVARVEKLVKKIRDELGGNGDGDGDDPAAPEELERVPLTEKGMIEALKARSDSLYDQLKQTTRFTISAAAIVATNAVLKITRFLKLKH